MSNIFASLGERGGEGRGGEDGKGGHLKAEGDRAQVAVGSAPAPSFKFGFKWRLHDLNSSFKAPVKFKNKFKPPVQFKNTFKAEFKFKAKFQRDTTI